MEMLWVAFLCFVMGMCAGKGSPHIAGRAPVINPTFHSKVNVVMREGPLQMGPWWKGGGIFAVDMENGMARTDIYLEGQTGQKPLHFHTLDRYDLQSTYTIDDLDSGKCKRNIVQGKLENPFAWVQKSEYSGTSTYMGFDLENWEYFDNATRTMHKISIKKSTSIPMFFSTRRVSNSTVSEWAMTFMQWYEENMPNWMIYVPLKCKFPEAYGSPGLVGDVPSVVYFANKNWDCADVACSSTVPSGSPQPGYECAEFVARSLCNGGYIPSVQPYGPQGSYASYGYNGQTYNLCVTTSLSSALTALGFQTMPASASSFTAGCAGFGDGGDGYFSHAVIGIAQGIDDAHNYARQNWPVTGSLYAGIDAVQCPSGSGSSGSASSSGSGTTSPSSASSSGSATSSNPSSSSGSSTYTSGTVLEDLKMDLAGGNAIYDVQTTPKNIISANILSSDNMPPKNVLRMEVNDVLTADKGLSVKEEKAGYKF